MKINEPAAVTWGPIAALLVTIAVFFGAQLFGSVVLYALFSLFGWDTAETFKWLTGTTFGQFFSMAVVKLLTFALLYWFITSRRSSLQALGLVRPQLRTLKYVLLGAVMYFPLSLGVASVIARLLPQLNFNQPQQIGFGGATAAPQLALVFVALVILPPLIEELLFRGFLWSGLKTKLPVIAAALVASLLFAAPHLQLGSGQPLLWAAFIDTFILSMVLIYVRVKSGSLWAAIGLHALKNGVAFTLLFIL